MAPAVGELAFFVAIGVCIGAVYALVAAGLIVIYSSSKVLNFAQGAYVLVGGIVAASLADGDFGSYLVAIVAAAVAGGACGLVSGLIIATPLLKRGVDLDLVIIATVGLAIAGEHAVAEFWGRTPKLVTGFLPRSGPTIGGATVPWHYLFMVLVACAVFAVLTWVYWRRNFGIQLRATASDTRAAQSMGVDAFRVVVGSWLVAGVLGGLAGALIGVVVPIQFSMAVSITVVAFASAMIGGMENPSAGLVGGVVYGVAEMVSSAYLPGGAQVILSSAIILLLIAVRPQGIFPARAIRAS